MIANTPGLFGGVAVQTAYDWINGGVFSVRKHDQPHAGKSKGTVPKRKAIGDSPQKSDGDCPQS